MRMKADRKAPPVTEQGKKTTELAKKCRDNPDDREAWAELYQAVRTILVHWSGVAVGLRSRGTPERGTYYTGFDRGDLEQAAWFAVVRAVETYDEEKSEFSHHLTIRVKAAMARYREDHRTTVHVPYYQTYPIAEGRRGQSYTAHAERARRPVHELAPDLAAPDADPSRCLGHAEDAAWLASAVEQLAARDPRAAEALVRVRGLFGREPELPAAVGASLGLCRKGVYYHVERAVRRLRAMADGTAPPARPRDARRPLGDCPACGKPYGSRRRDHVCRPAGASCDCPDCGRPFGKLRRCYWCNPPNRKAS